MTTETEKPSYDPEARGLRLVAVLLGLTVVSGLIDAVSYLGLGHVFTANMTGNVVVLGFAAAGAPGFSVPHTLTSLCCFLLGAVAGAAWRYTWAPAPVGSGRGSPSRRRRSWWASRRRSPSRRRATPRRRTHSSR